MSRHLWTALCAAIVAILFTVALLDGLIGLSGLGILIVIASMLMGLIGLAGSIAMIYAALSLKRIERTLSGDGESILTRPINAYGEGIGDAIQGQMIRGQRGIDQYEGR